MKTFLDDIEITEYFDECVSRLKMATPGWSWNNRLSSTLGRADLSRNLIEFSPKLWLAVPTSYRPECIAHELCHILVQDGHTDAWFDSMISLGYQEPMKYLDIMLESTIRYGTCRCEHPHVLKKAVFTRDMNRGIVHTCRDCSHTIHWS